MFGSNSNRRDVRAIATPVVSFALLGVLIVGAVIFGNLVLERSDACRPLGVPAGNHDSATLLVWSDKDDALMLCDVSAKTVQYDSPPVSNDSWALVSKARLRLYTGDEVLLPDSLVGKVQGSDLMESDQSVLLYKRGEFGEVEDCYGDPYALEDDDDIWNEDPYGLHSDPDAIESCWLEFEDLSRYVSE